MVGVKHIAKVTVNIPDHSLSVQVSSQDCFGIFLRPRMSVLGPPKSWLTPFPFQPALVVRNFHLPTPQGVSQLHQRGASDQASPLLPPCGLKSPNTFQDNPSRWPSSGSNPQNQASARETEVAHLTMGKGSRPDSSKGQSNSWGLQDDTGAWIKAKRPGELSDHRSLSRSPETSAELTAGLAGEIPSRTSGQLPADISEDFWGFRT